MAGIATGRQQGKRQDRRQKRARCAHGRRSSILEQIRPAARHPGVAVNGKERTLPPLARMQYSELH